MPESKHCILMIVDYQPFAIYLLHPDYETFYFSTLTIFGGKTLAGH
jgi:hypothetical protein